MAQAILIQGMRRSGTTILYDALLEDPGLHCFYEPLREETETPGGGSGARATDPFAETRALRRAYRDEHWPDLDLAEFNLGGPRQPRREIGPEMPEHCAGFLRTLLDGDEPVLIKETRLYDKLERSAAWSTRGRGPRPRRPRSARGRCLDDDRAKAQASRAYATADEFFAEREKRKLWSSRALSQAPAASGAEYADSAGRRTSSASCWSGSTPSRAPGARAGSCSATATCCSATRSLRRPDAAIARIYAAVGRAGRRREVTEWAAARCARRRSPSTPRTRGGPAPSLRARHGRGADRGRLRRSSRSRSASRDGAAGCPSRRSVRPCHSSLT